MKRALKTVAGFAAATCVVAYVADFDGRVVIPVCLGLAIAAWRLP